MDDVQPVAKPTPDEIEAIVIDLDGTLLNSEHVMTDRTRDTIRRAIDAGKRIILATGKTRASAESVIAALNLSTPGVFVQGMVIFNADGSIRHQQMVDVQAARRVIQYAENSGCEVLAYSGNRLIARHDGEPFEMLTDYHEPAVEAVGPLVNKLGQIPIHKFIIFGSPRKLKALRWQLNQQVGDAVSFTTTALSDQLEILPKGGSKGSGLRVLLRELNIHPNHVIAIGDALNDAEMLKLVRLGVAMGNAAEGLKKVADVITSSNDEDGVAEVIEQYVLGEEPGAQADEDEETTAEAPAADATTPDSETTESDES
ncbi:MAG: HAD family hydrolase [Anaerolineae bacterium]|nr:HAD family hydrolase [Anaerolineae bacterium]